MDFRHPFNFAKEPNKLIIRYSVATKPDEKKDMLMPIVRDVKQDGSSAKKTHQECIDIFVELTTELDNEDVLFAPIQ